MRRLALALAVAAVGAVPTAAQAETVATPGAATAVKEYAGTIVFSQLDRATSQWFLTARRAGAAAPERLPVAPSGRPFDADIGPDSAGRPEVIYSRCSNPPGVPRGCDLFVTSLDGATGERPVRNANDPDHNDTNPTLWRGRIAWARDYGSGSEPNPIVYTKALTAPRSQPSRRLPGVPQRRTGDVDRVTGPTSGRTVQDLELWGSNLALTVSYGCRGCSGIDQSELRLDDLDTGRARQVAFQVVGLSGQTLVGPSFFNGRLGWYKACLGDPSGCIGGQAGPWRYALGSRTYQRGTVGPARVDGFADTGTLLYEALGCSNDDTDVTSNANCRIDTLPPPAYPPARAPLR